MSAQHKPMHALAILHVVAMGSLLIWWSVYFWRHTPARELLTGGRDTPIEHHRPGSHATVAEHAAGEFGRHTRTAAAALALAGADAAGGLVVLALFAVGTGIYVRRFEIWLQARASGEAMTFAGTGLDDKALAANNTQERRT